MANSLVDNTYFILDTSPTALSWPSNARVQSVVFYAINTNASAVFLLAVNSPILRFNLINQASMGGTISLPTTYSYNLNGVRFPTAWIPSTLTACSAWIHFA